MREWRASVRDLILLLPMTLFGTISASMNSLSPNPLIIEETLSLLTRSFLFPSFLLKPSERTKPIFIPHWLIPFWGPVIKLSCPVSFVFLSFNFKRTMVGVMFLAVLFFPRVLINDFVVLTWSNILFKKYASPVVFRLSLNI